jgi:transglutaminase-like putative cysteine protease
MKKILTASFILFCFVAIGQGKSSIIFKSEIITIKNPETGLSIESKAYEKRLILKAKNFNDYQFVETYNNFSDITEITGFITNLKTEKRSKLEKYNITAHDAEMEGVFHSDLKYKNISFGALEDSSMVELNVSKIYHNPRLLKYFEFQDGLKTDKSKFEIIADKNVEIGYKLFGENTDKIKFTKTEGINTTSYNWESENVAAFKGEANMPSGLYYMPHIIYYIKSYDNNGVKENNLNNVDDLYKWYFGLVKDSNLKDQTEIKKTVSGLIQNSKSDQEKAQQIFQWVQKNLHYVAFEYGMGGFIPRDAADVFDKKYGDCKDMANLINEMLKAAGLNSSLTWIGTRDKPYSYLDLPSPFVDNHMIASVLIDNKRFFLDATDKFCPFGYPTAMIQGKESLVGIDDSKYQIEKVPIVASEKNKKQITINYSLSNNNIKGTATVNTSGFNKSRLLNILAANSSVADDIWKSVFVASNEKINSKITSKVVNEYSNEPTTVNYEFLIDNWVKSFSGKTVLKPCLMFPFKDSNVETEHRNYGIEMDYLEHFSITYNIEIPEKSTVEFLPKDSFFENDYGKVAVNYKLAKNVLVVSQEVKTKKIIFTKNEIPYWNDFVKNCNKLYNQSIILKNE